MKKLLGIILLLVCISGDSASIRRTLLMSRQVSGGGGGGGSNVTFDTAAKAGCGVAVLTRTINITVANNANRVLVVMTNSGDDSGTDRVVASVSSDVDGAFTHIASSDADDANFVRTEGWRKTAPTAGAHVITVTFVGTVLTAEAYAVSLYGVDQTTPIGTPTVVTGTSSTPNGAVTLGSDDMAIGALTSDSDSTLSWTTGTTTSTVTTGCNSDISQGCVRNTGSGSVSVQASTDNQSYGLTVLPVNGAP